MSDLDASYSGISNMIDGFGPEETLHHLQQEWVLQLSKKHQAEIDLRRADGLESQARVGLANFVKKVYKNGSEGNIINDPKLGEAYVLSSINKNQVINIRINLKTCEASFETFKAFILTKKDDENGDS